MNVFEIPHLDSSRYALSSQRPVVGWHTRLRPGNGQAEWDMHYELELILVLDGQVRIHDSAGDTNLKAGQVWFGSVWEPHGWTRTHRAEVVLFLLWPPAVATVRFEEAPQINWLAAFTTPPRQRPQTPPAQRAAMIALGRRLATLLDAGKPTAGLQLRLVILEALALLYENWTPPKPTRAAAPNAFARINHAIQLVLNANRLVTVDEAATLCGLSRNSFAQQFERIFGLSFTKFALRHRISCAASDLIRTDLPLKAIARNWGFADESHLDHRFRDVYGVTPAVYRRNAGQPPPPMKANQ